jgi:cell division septal protein FtsQ
MVDQGGTTVKADVAPREPEIAPPLDSHAVEHAYRLHRARRRARFERHREKRRAGLRFWLVVLVLVAASLALGVLIVQEVQRLFGV